MIIVLMFLPTRPLKKYMDNYTFKRETSKKMSYYFRSLRFIITASLKLKNQNRFGLKNKIVEGHKFSE